MHIAQKVCSGFGRTTCIKTKKEARRASGLGEEHGGFAEHGSRGDHRRRCRWYILAISSRQGGLDRLRASGKERADLRLDLACRRQCADLLLVLVADEHAA